MASPKWLHRKATQVSLSVVVLATLATTLASCSSEGGPVAAQKPPPHHAHGRTARAVDRPLSIPKTPVGSTLLANIHRVTQGYLSPGGDKAMTIPPTWHGAASILPVVASQAGWVDVRLAQRPNESTAWVPVKDVTLTSTPYKILVDLKTTKLSLFKANRLVFGAPVGVGTAADPTPTGTFFVAFFAAPPSPGYAPFVIVSSAHSNTISDWESSGDALMAIHGPLGSDAQIGRTGAYVSHGCVRLHAADLVHLRVVPAGSPIVVVAS